MMIECSEIQPAQVDYNIKRIFVRNIIFSNFFCYAFANPKNIHYTLNCI